MSAFKALNIESDVESDEEIDDTKEIQIEEALKLYQNALKYHSEGPRSFAEAAQAYKALFESEIFKYPESLSEYRRTEINGDPDYDFVFQEDYEAGPIQLSSAADSAPNTLPQILHLSYKNHGQFMLEVLQHRLREHQDALASLDSVQAIAAAEGPLRYFAEGIDKDDTDFDLWSRTASVAALAGSSRIARFCLEAILDGDDEGLDSVLRLPGLEEGFSGQQLRELVEHLQDDLSLMQGSLSSIRRKKLSAALKRRLAPYDFTPLPAEVKKRNTLEDALSRPPLLLSLNSIKSDWAHVGDAILNEYLQEQQRTIDPGPGVLVAINFPDITDVDAFVNSGPAGNGSVEVSARPSQEQGAESKTQTEHRDGKASAGNGEDTEMKEVGDNKSDQEGARNGRGTSAGQSDRPSAPSRKRSTDSAGLPETAEGGRGRSKRLRARESVGDGTLNGAPGVDTTQRQVENELNQFEQADEWLFEIVGEMLGKLDAKGLGSPKALRDTLRDNQSEMPGVGDQSLKTAARDLYAILQLMSPQAAALLMTGDSIDLLGGASREAGLNAFLGYTKSASSQASNRPMLAGEGLSKWSQSFRAGGVPIKELLWSWLECMLRPGAFPSTAQDSGAQPSSYMRHQWSDELKRIVVQAIVNSDDFVYERLSQEASDLDSKILRAEATGNEVPLTDKDNSLIEMIQTVFELHLDVYSLIRHPTSSVDVSTQTLQKERLERWTRLARDAVGYTASAKRESLIDELDFRHLWASTFHLSVSDDVSQDHVIVCMEELKTIAGLLHEPILHLQNNAVMPELSAAAAERELTKINMKDCFIRVFQHDEKDPVSVIESLEPILESSTPIPTEPNMVSGTEVKDSQDSDDADTPSTQSGEMVQNTTSDVRPSALQAMTQFISTANVSLRLSLWQRLRQAYEAINYPAKVVSCYLRSIEILVEDMKSVAYREAPLEQRNVDILKWLRIIDEIFFRVVKLFSTEGVLECIDEAHMRSSLNSVGELLWLLNTVHVYQDSIRVGQLSAPTFDGRLNSVFPAVMAKLHDIQVRGWMLQWFLFGDALLQNSELFPKPNEDKFEYLRHLHYAFGIRGICASSNKLLLRIMKDELLRMFKNNEIADVETRDTVFCQVLYDLHGLFCFTNPSDRTEYPSEHDPLDQKTSLRLLDFLMYQTRKLTIKDLHKTQVGATIDVIHGHLARAKPAGVEDLALNRMKYLSFIKSPINPLDLYRCVNGIGVLSTKPIAAKNARIASKGWHFLMGTVALNRFRSQNQKRQAPVPTEDINIASAFFIQDLEYDAERWETWYSQAQAHDYQLDEMLAWSAEKVNKGDPDLVQYQRSAIHCYTMAVATAIRNADASEETARKMAQLYSDFGMRIYSSSRDPLSMQAFQFKDNEDRFYSMQQVMRAGPFRPMLPVAAWKFASGLFRRAIAGKPDHWMNHYMLGKCLWKLHTAHETAISPKHRPAAQEVVESFVRAIEELPEKRGGRGEPILEPHYKLISIIHKLVHRKEIEPKAASETLQATHYARQVPIFSPEEDGEDQEDWDDYVLKVLKIIRGADRSNWHHRITARVARIHYGDPSPLHAYMAALTAKNVFSQQIFTKTMQLQVWKPEYERLGRHFVYTTRYTMFFILLLSETNDRAGMEALARRVRRRNHEFYDHPRLWQTLCHNYLKMLRRVGRVPSGHEDAVFKSMNHEEWTSNATRLEAWCHSPSTSSNTYSILGEAIELRRLNNNLMKATLIDDLIGDTYALLYEQVVPTLQSEPEQAPPPAQPQTQPTQPAPVAVERTNMMSMQNIMNLDGAPPGPEPASIAAVAIATAPPFHVMTMQSQPGAAVATPPETTAAAAPPKPRAKGVGRRELMRRADAAVARPVAPAAAAAAAATNIPIRASAAPSAPPAETRPVAAADYAQTRAAAEPKQGGAGAAAEGDAGVDGGEGQGEGDEENQGEGDGEGEREAVEPSAPGSMHDSADDESELSELDDDLEDPEEAEEGGTAAATVKTEEGRRVGSDGVTKMGE